MLLYWRKPIKPTEISDFADSCFRMQFFIKWVGIEFYFFGSGHFYPCRWVPWSFKYHQGCPNNPIFSNLGLCTACWTHFMCHCELRPTSLSHTFSFHNRCFGLAGGKYYQEITIPRLILQILLFQAAFLIFCTIISFPLICFWLGVIVVYSCSSVQGIFKKWNVEFDIKTRWAPLHLCMLFLFIFP